MAARHFRRDRARRKGFRHDPSFDLVAPATTGPALWLRCVDYLLDHICEPICARWIACCRSTRRREGGVKRPLTLNCFTAMLDGIVEISGIPREKLIPEISAVHQKHGTSEYSLLIDEMPSLKPILKGRPATEVFAAPIEGYRLQRRKHLHLFPTVAETLLKIKGRGASIIGYTESMAFYSNYRVRRLGLDGVLNYVFCPEDHVLPDGLSTEDLRQYPASHYELKYSKQDFTPKGSKKPDPKVLDTIINDLGLNKADCVYVGDNLMKDVAMALDCRVDDVWAKYGQAHKRPEYKLLQDVTHWTPEEVEREQKIREREHVHPTHTLEGTFSEILDLFDFKDFHG
jgi:FMN phosphatase YigB (HAD superfamily)